MSEANVAPQRFWNTFKSEVAATLSEEQREEINRVLSEAKGQQNSEISNIRLSFKWFFVRLSWGAEKRTPERIKREQEMDPVFSRRNLPMLASLFLGYLVFLFAALAGSSWLLVTLIS